MTYSIKVEQIGEAGTPIGAADLYKTDDKANAITIAAFAVDTGDARQRRVATVLDTTGHLIVSYAGRSSDGRR